MGQYHVSLGGQGYLLDLRGYRRRAHAPFAPKTSQGERGYGDLVHDQAYRVSDWRGGEGFARADPEHPERWRSGFGVDVFSEPGSPRLGPELVSTGTATAFDELTVAQVYQGNLYVGTGHGRVYRWDGTTWSLSIDLAKAGGVRSMATYRGKLYVGNGGDGAVAELSGTTWTAAKFTAAGATGVRAMATFYRQTSQYLYVACSGASNGFVHWWDGATLAAKAYDFEEPQPEVALVLSNRLYFFVGDPQSRRGAVYSVDDSGSGGVYRAHVGLSEGYPTCGAIWDGTIYLGVGLEGGVAAWDGARLSLVRQLGTVGAPYGSELRGMAVWGGALWLSIADGSGTVGLLRYDGAGWTRPASGLLGTEPRGLAVYGGQLHVLTQKGGAAAMHRTNGTYRSSGQVEMGLFDAGLPSVDKVLRSVTLTHAPLGRARASGWSTGSRGPAPGRRSGRPRRSGRRRRRSPSPGW